MKQGTMMVGYQPLGNKGNFFRVVVFSPLVTQRDMDFFLDEIERLGNDLWTKTQLLRRLALSKARQMRDTKLWNRRTVDQNMNGFYLWISESNSCSQVSSVWNNFCKAGDLHTMCSLFVHKVSEWKVSKPSIQRLYIYLQKSWAAAGYFHESFSV